MPTKKNASKKTKSARGVDPSLQLHNSVFFNKHGWAETQYYGDQTHDTVMDTFREYQVLEAKFAKTRSHKRNKIKHLIDITKLGDTDSAARKAAVDVLNQIKYTKLAVYGGNTFTRVLANLIIKAANKGSKVQYFNTREEAESWLKG